MKCPACGSHSQPRTILSSASSATCLAACGFCHTLWSVHHGAVRVVEDAQKNSFLETITECVEGDDYHLVA